MSTLGKLAYLEDTKNSLFEMIEFSNGGITYDTFRNYAKALFGGYINVLNNPSQLFEALPKILYIPTTETSLTVRDTLYAPMKLTLKPNLYQANIKGINLCEGSQDFSGTWGNISYWETDDNTYNGLVVKKCSQTEKGISKTIQLSESGYYTISFYIKNNGLNTEVMFSDGDAGGGEWNFTTSSAWERKTFQFQYYVLGEPETTDITIENISVDEGACTYICGLQVELNSTSSPYEPYTGGTAYIPTPSTPQPIHTITGENTITVCGKNLYDIENTSYTAANGATITKTDNDIKVENGANQFGSARIYLKDMNIKPNSTYTLSAKIKSTNTSGGSKVYYSRTQTYSSAATEGNTATLTFSTTSTIANNEYIGLYPIEANKTTTFTNIQIEKGSTATTYEPYKGNSYEIDLDGKNLIPTNEFTLIRGTNRTIQIEFDKPIPAGTYTLSCKITNQNGFTTNEGLGWALYDGTTSPVTNRGSFATIVSTTTSPYSNTRTITGQATYLYCFLNNSLDNSATITITDLQLEKGSTATEYAPYFTPIELCKIGDYEDKFIRTTGKNLCYNITNPSTTNLYFYLNNKALQKTFTLSFTSNVTLTNNSVYLNVDGDTSFGVIGTISTDSSNKAKSTITLSDSVYNAIINGTTVNLNVYKSGISFTIPTDGMVENSSTATSYEPYGNYWYIEKNTDKLILNGTEIYNNQNGIYDTTERMMFNRQANITSQMANRKAFCNYFINYNYTVQSAEVNVTAFNFHPNAAYSNNLYFKIDRNVLPTQDATGFANWVKDHNLIIYYQIATPTYTKIDSEELIGQLEAIKTIKSQNGQTNIIQENTDLPFILNAEILDDLNKNWWY